MTKENLRARLHAGEIIQASFLTLRDPATVALMAAAGFECLILDLEHTRHHAESMESMLRACREAGVQSMVRLPGLCPEWIAWALDSGTDGLLLPMAEEPRQLQTLTELSLYPQDGRRGFTGLSPATGWGKKRSASYLQDANNALLIGVQIENARAIANLGVLLENPRIDLFFLGTGDLAVDLGVPGQYDHPAFRETLENFFSTLTGRVRSGLYGSRPALLRRGQKLGAQLLVQGSDSFFLLEGARHSSGYREG